MKGSALNRGLQLFLQNMPRKHGIVSRLKPLLPSPLCGLCHGYWMEFDVTDVIQRLMYFGQYEPVQSQWVRDILTPGDFFLDIGANVGHYTTLAARLVQDRGRVLAFEPSPYAYKKLSAVVQQNQITQVSLFQCAAGEAPGDLDLYLPCEDYLHSPSLVKSNPSYTPVKVKVCRLDDHHALGPTRIIDLMKVDVEGFEPNVLNGMKTLLRAGNVRNLMCEFNSGWLEANKSSCQMLLDLICELGFEKIKETELARVVSPNGLVYHYQDVLFRHRLNDSRPKTTL